MTFSHHELIMNVFINHICEKKCGYRFNICIAYEFHKLFQYSDSIHLFENNSHGHGKLRICMTFQYPGPSQPAVTPF